MQKIYICAALVVLLISPSLAAQNKTKVITGVGSYPFLTEEGTDDAQDQKDNGLDASETIGARIPFLVAQSYSLGFGAAYQMAELKGKLNIGGDASVLYDRGELTLFYNEFALGKKFDLSGPAFTLTSGDKDILEVDGSAPQTVTLTITTSVDQAGELRLTVYNSERGFKTRDELFSIVRAISGEPVSLEVTVPEAGDYVLAAFHDLNGNGELDLNISRAPIEPYGFGRVPLSKWREPEFAEISTTVPASGASATIQLKKWKEY